MPFAPRRVSVHVVDASGEATKDGLAARFIRSYEVGHLLARAVRFPISLP